MRPSSLPAIRPARLPARCPSVFDVVLPLRRPPRMAVVKPAADARRPWTGATAGRRWSTSNHDGWAQCPDPIEDAPKQVPGHCHLGHLEDEVAAVGDDFRADLYQPS